MAEWIWDEELQATVRLEDYERMSRNRKRNRSRQQSKTSHEVKRNGSTYITYSVKEPEPAGCAMPAHVIRDMNLMLVKARIMAKEDKTS